MDLAERTMIDTLETGEVGHNKAFIKDALRGSLSSIQFFILKNESGIREAFGTTIIKVSTSKKVVSKTTKALATDAAGCTPNAKFCNGGG